MNDLAIDLSLPEPVGRGKVGAERRDAKDDAVEAWCARSLKIKPTLDFDPEARGWCYILEEHGLPKGDFDGTDKLITKCRKNSRLPIDFCRDEGGFAHSRTLMNVIPRCGRRTT
jgi:hypothetical protein